MVHKLYQRYILHHGYQNGSNEQTEKWHWHQYDNSPAKLFCLNKPQVWKTLHNADQVAGKVQRFQRNKAIQSTDLSNLIGWKVKVPQVAEKFQPLDALDVVAVQTDGLKMGGEGDISHTLDSRVNQTQFWRVQVDLVHPTRRHVVTVLENFFLYSETLQVMVCNF